MFTVRCKRSLKPAFHDANTDTDFDSPDMPTSLCPTDTRDFLKLFLRQAERHDDILATILARMSARMSVSASWNAGLKSQPCSWNYSASVDVELIFEITDEDVAVGVVSAYRSVEPAASLAV